VESATMALKCSKRMVSGPEQLSRAQSEMAFVTALTESWGLVRLPVNC
jgi:hypothetical protein